MKSATKDKNLTAGCLTPVTQTLYPFLSYPVSGPSSLPVGSPNAQRVGASKGGLGGLGVKRRLPSSSCNSGGFPDIQPLDFCTEEKNDNVLHEKVTCGCGESLPQCGEVRFKIVCPDNPKHYEKLVRYSCHKASCPVCYQSWAVRAAKKAAARLDESRKILKHKGKARHIVISPDVVPFDDTTPESLHWLYKEGARVSGVSGLGSLGSLPILHPYRMRKNFERVVNDSASAAGVNRYQWALAQENWRDYVYFSPHFHLHVFGPLPDYEKFHDLTGWRYVNFDDNLKAGREGPELVKSIYYLLTHAWVKDNSKVIRYWGDLSNKRLIVKQVDTIKESCFCPDCSSHLRVSPLDAVDSDGVVKPFYQDLHNAGRAYRDIPVYIYMVRAKKKKVKNNEKII